MIHKNAFINKKNSAEKPILSICFFQSMRRRRSTKNTKKMAKDTGEEVGDDWIPSTVMSGAGWKARGDRKPKEKRVPFNRSTPYQVISIY